MQVAGLLEPPGREGERGAGHDAAQAAAPELARKQVRAEEGEREREQEEQVVAGDRRLDPVADQPAGA